MHFLLYHPTNTGIAAAVIIICSFLTKARGEIFFVSVYIVGSNSFIFSSGFSYNFKLDGK